MSDLLQRATFYLLLIGLIGVICKMLMSAVVKWSPEDTDPADDEQELCAKCGYDARNLAVCPECGMITRKGRRDRLAALRNDWPSEPIEVRAPGPDEQPKIVLTLRSDMAVKLLCQHLGARGIAARMTVSETEIAGRSLGPTLYNVGVWSQDEERAKAIIQHLWPEDNDLAD